MTRRWRIWLIAYLAGLIFTFGNVAARNEPDYLAAPAGFYAGLFWPIYWPLYWSWELQS